MESTKRIAELESTEFYPSASLANSNQRADLAELADHELLAICLLYTSPSPRDKRQSRMPSSA